MHQGLGAHEEALPVRELPISLWIEKTTEKDIPDDEPDEDDDDNANIEEVEEDDEKKEKKKKKKKTVQEVTHAWGLMNKQKSLWMRNPRGHQGGIRHLLQAHQPQLGGSPHCEAHAYDGAARVQEVTVKEPPAADSQMYCSSYLAETEAGAEQWHMASMQRERNLIAACFVL